VHTIRRGAGRKLVLVHGLGGSWRSWATILPSLAERREVIAIDLPGHGRTPAGPDSTSFPGLARSLENFLIAQDLVGTDMVGSSIGGRLVLEMSRRGLAGAVVSLDPGGFWHGWERTFLKTTLLASARLVRSIKPTIPAIARSKAARTLLLAQLSARPWALPRALIQTELASVAATRTFDMVVRDLAARPAQKGPAAPGGGSVVIGWGRHDRLCLPVQAERARAAFPSAHLHWFEKSGHFPHWDEPDETIRLIRDTIG
jgi:pimeloyl-ACP methyl ester carboxylesterase